MADDAEPSLGLTPVTHRPADWNSRYRWKRWIAVLVTATVVIAVVLLTANLLGDAALFFYNADEAVERRDELGQRRFKIQGTPLAEPDTAFRDDLPVLIFSIGFNGVVVDVVHTGDPPDLFQPGVPVVLEGAWEEKSVAALSVDLESYSDTEEHPNSGSQWHFASDRMMVKHDNDYRDRDNYRERVAEADLGGVPS